MNENYDGVLVLGTALDTQELEKELKRTEEKLKEYQKQEKNILENKLGAEQDLKNAEELNQKIEKLRENLKQINEERKKYEYISKMIQSASDFGGPMPQLTDEQQAQLVKDNKLKEQAISISQELNKLEEDRNDLVNGREVLLGSLNRQLENNRTKQEDLKQSTKDINNELRKRYGLEDIKNRISDINKGLSGIVKKALKWGLAIFGIRTMFNFIRSSMSTIAQGDPQLKADIDYIKNILAYVIEPIVRKIIELAKQLLTFVGAIIYKWTGWNMFKDASENLKKAKNNAQALQKTMAKFDEMNVLNGGNNTPNPSFDFALDVENYDFDKAYKKVDEVLNKIKKQFNKTFDDIQNNIMKTMLDNGASAKLIEYWYEATEGVQKMINGIGDVFRGLFDVIYGLLTGNKELIWQGVTKIVSGLVLIIEGFLQWIINSVKLVIQFCKDLGEKIGNWVYKTIIKPIIESFRAMFDWVINGFKNAWSSITTGVIGFKDKVVGIFSTIVEMFRNIGTKVGDAIGNAFKSVINYVLERTEKILNKPIEAINSLINAINSFGIPGVRMSKLSRMSFPRLAKGGILNNPGKGVYVGGAIAGESGREFYMPLQDEQMLQLVGQSIGKYITINANITNTMNGRIISRELQKIQNENDFAFNR